MDAGVDSGLRRNDGGGCVRDFVRNSKGAIGMAKKPIPTPVVILAKAGIQWFRQAIPAKRE